MAETVSAMIH
jgi:uncharacterized protein GlcG (DUF336 family)